MKTSERIMMESKLLEKMDELTGLESTLDRILFLLDDLVEVIFHIEAEDPELAEQLSKLYSPLVRKAKEVAVRMGDLSKQSDRLYADILIREADVSASIPPVMHLMPPPYLEHSLFSK